MRDYKKEYKKEKEKYDIIKIKVDKQLSTEFKEKVKSENNTITGWLTDKIKKYLFVKDEEC